MTTTTTEDVLCRVLARYRWALLDIAAMNLHEVERRARDRAKDALSSDGLTPETEIRVAQLLAEHQEA